MKNIKSLIGAASLMFMTANGNTAGNRTITCKVDTSMGRPATVTIMNNKVTVTGGYLKKPREFENVIQVNGLVP